MSSKVLILNKDSLQVRLYDAQLTDEKHTFFGSLSKHLLTSLSTSPSQNFKSQIEIPKESKILKPVQHQQLHWEDMV